MRSLLPSAIDRQLLGVAPLTGPTPWLIAIMSFTILLIAAAGFGIANSASRFENSIGAHYVIELPGGDARLDALTAALRSTDGIKSVTVESEAAMRATLRRWLGPLAESPEMPVPALVTIELDTHADERALRAAVGRFGPGIRVEANRVAVGPILRSLRALQWVAMAMVTMLVIAASAGIVLAARAALDTHRSTIEVLHGIGATDGQITDLFQRKIALDALVGSLAGAALAAAVLLTIAAGSAFLGQLTGGATLSGGNLVLLALLPLALTTIAVLVSRAAVLARLRKAL